MAHSGGVALDNNTSDKPFEFNLSEIDLISCNDKSLVRSIVSNTAGAPNDQKQKIIAIICDGIHRTEKCEEIGYFKHIYNNLIESIGEEVKTVLECIYLSDDENEDQFNTYIKSLHPYWKAFQFKSPDADRMRDKYFPMRDFRYIRSGGWVCIIDESGKILSSSHSEGSIRYILSEIWVNVHTLLNTQFMKSNEHPEKKKILKR